MSGGSKELGTYYYLPNVPYIMFFYNDQYAKKLGFSIHGAYWHNNFGKPMSHGCINMKPAEAAVIYNWAEVNLPITIYGKYSSTISSR
jgi:lipoprotein-anchoring transpeptidase ErfK/SrfK